MKATKAGVCAICNRPYPKGARIRFNQDDTGKNVHENCRRKVAKVRKRLGEK